MERYIVLITMHADPAMAPGYDEWGGTHTYMKELLDEFGKRKIRCLMFTRRSMQYLPYEEQYNEYCTVYRLTNGDNEPMSKTLLKKYHSQNVEQILEIIKKQGRLPEKCPERTFISKAIIPFTIKASLSALKTILPSTSSA